MLVHAESFVAQSPAAASAAAGEAVFAGRTAVGLLRLVCRAWCVGKGTRTAKERRAAWGENPPCFLVARRCGVVLWIALGYCDTAVQTAGACAAHGGAREFVGRLDS